MVALTFEQIREKVAGRFGDAVGPTVSAKDPFVVVKADRLLDVARFLHDDPEVALDYLMDETAVDYPKENLIRVVYHLYSMTHKHAFKFKVECHRAAPRLPSVESIWRGANWLEREVWDLFGVCYDGHPDLRRILMPVDWPGHPLRKDWTEQGGYHGIRNERVSGLDLYLERDKKNRPSLAPPPAPAKAEAAAPVKAEAAAPAKAVAASATAGTPPESVKAGDDKKSEGT
jgi:NADH-quinone oxidoreductase subunit C